MEDHRLAADVYFGRDKRMPKDRSTMKQKTILKRKKSHLLNSLKSMTYL